MSQDPNPLSRSLTRQAEHFERNAHAGVSVDDVLDRAGQIRRGRRLRASLVMTAVVLAIAVPVAIQAIDESTRPPVPAAQDHSPITLDNLSYGDPPRTPYSADWVLHVGGNTLVLPGRERPSYLAQIQHGFLVGTFGSGQTQAQVLSADGSDTGSRFTLQGGFAVSTDGNVGAFVQPDGSVVAIEIEADGVRSMVNSKVLSGTTFEAVAVEGGGCQGTGVAAAGCTVYVNQTDGDPKIWAVTARASPQVVRPGLLNLTDISRDGLFAGYTSFSDDGSCSEVRDAAEAVLWKTCKHRLSTFSPDGKHLLASGPYGDGAGDEDLSILDARTGKAGLDLRTADGAVVTQVKWEDDTHVLAVVVQHELSAIIRFDLNGNRTFARPQVTAQEFVSPFLLATLGDQSQQAE
jgi:hypothetical protein